METKDLKKEEVKTLTPNRKKLQDTKGKLGYVKVIEKLDKEILILKKKIEVKEQKVEELMKLL